MGRRLKPTKSEDIATEGNNGIRYRRLDEGRGGRGRTGLPIEFRILKSYGAFMQKRKRFSHASGASNTLIIFIRVCSAPKLGHFCQATYAIPPAPHLADADDIRHFSQNI